MRLAPGATQPPKAGTAAGWQWGRVMQAPHRLGFLLAMGVLGASAAWWALVQAGRLGLAPSLPMALSPTLTHAAVMTLGFIPLFFGGFLFTAGPRWLGVEGPTARQVLPALALQAGGWLLWLAGAHLHLSLAAAGAGLAGCGLGLATWRFTRLVRASPEPDQTHARVIAGAHWLGVGCTFGLAAALALDAQAVARLLVLTALWGFVLVVYLSVAHRMIPFFTTSALPMLHAWRPGWVLALMIGAAGFEAGAVWVDAAWGDAPAWRLLRGTLEIATGGVLVALAFAWHLVKSLRIRLLAMLHLGFVWLGLALLLGGATQWLAALTGQIVLPLAALHALTMGCLASLMLAMVTRVSCGHSGRPLVADNLMWGLFGALQLATLLRIAGAAQGSHAQAVLGVTATLWAAIMLTWGTRLANWYGRPRADGRPG
ncbi:NnrS family protein [Ramlibacter sp.]|uniref:NnrS family protein n=1 Tax=Ramlibacter sp. TaxID=1917967 RepID=UPI0035AF1116